MFIASAPGYRYPNCVLKFYLQIVVAFLVAKHSSQRSLSTVLKLYLQILSSRDRQ